LFPEALQLGSVVKHSSRFLMHVQDFQQAKRKQVSIHDEGIIMISGE
jgi:hypothetical protein